MGGDIIATWYAADNIQSAAPFYMRGIAQGVKDGSIDPNQADELINEAVKNFNIATTTINKSTRYNPALWPFRKIYMSGVEQKKAETNLVIDQIRGTGIPAIL
jgi:hypothetical protein